MLESYQSQDVYWHPAIIVKIRLPGLPMWQYAVQDYCEADKAAGTVKFVECWIFHDDLYVAS